jgi:hypothetical protein
MQAIMENFIGIASFYDITGEGICSFIDTKQ